MLSLWIFDWIRNEGGSLRVKGENLLLLLIHKDRELNEL